MATFSATKAPHWIYGRWSPELPDHLSRYLNAVRDGREVTVTDHGTAVARLVPLDRPRTLDRLINEGLVEPAPTIKRPRTGPAIKSKGAVSDLVAEQRW